jgi:hypothetical protein
MVTAAFGWPGEAAAEWHLKPFIGVTFGGETTFYDLELAAGNAHLVLGGSGLLIGEVFGIEGDFGYLPGFFEDDEADLVLKSSVRTLAGNLVVGLPRRLTEYTLRPYVVGGFGVMWVRSQDNPLGPGLGVADRVAAVDFGGGVTGFLTDRVGVGWDLRHFRSLGGEPGLSPVQEDGRLSFWRANMSLVLRY